MPGAHLGVGKLMAQLAHGGGHEEIARVAEDDPAGSGGGSGLRRGLMGGAQQGQRLGQEHLPSFGETAALGGAIEQADVKYCASRRSRITGDAGRSDTA
jgi:hypothetical protein